MSARLIRVCSDILGPGTLVYVVVSAYGRLTTYFNLKNSPDATVDVCRAFFFNIPVVVQ